MSTYVRTQSIDETIGERGRVSLSFVSADVRARAIPGGDVHLQATFEISAASDAEADRIFEEIQLRVERERGDLNVTEHDGSASIGSMIGRLFGGRGRYELSIQAELPVAASVALTVVSSEVVLTGLHGEQRYRTVSGDLQVSEAGGSLDVETVSGDVSIRAEQPLAVRAQGVSGDLSIAAPQLGGLRATTVSGDVEIEAELADRGDFRVETVSGDLAFALIGSATFEIHGISTDVSSELDHRLEGQIDRRRLIVGKGGPRLVFNSMSGDVDVRRPRRAVAVKQADAGTATSAADAGGAAPPDPADQLEVLRALERGEIDVDEASRRLAGGA